MVPVPRMWMLLETDMGKPETLAYFLTLNSFMKARLNIGYDYWLIIMWKILNQKYDSVPVKITSTYYKL